MFTRQLGHKSELPGAGQWCMLSRYKTEQCWVCDKHIYTILFWSPHLGLHHSLNPLNGKQLIQSILDNQSNTLLDKKQPYITSSFSNWQYQPMLDLEAFCALIDQHPPDFYQAVKARKLVRADFPPLD